MPQEYTSQASGDTETCYCYATRAGAAVNVAKIKTSGRVSAVELSEPGVSVNAVTEKLVEWTFTLSCTISLTLW